MWRRLLPGLPGTSSFRRLWTSDAAAPALVLAAAPRMLTEAREWVKAIESLDAAGKYPTAVARFAEAVAAGALPLHLKPSASGPPLGGSAANPLLLASFSEAVARAALLHVLFSAGDVDAASASKEGLFIQLFELQPSTTAPAPLTLPLRVADGAAFLGPLLPRLKGAWCPASAHIPAVALGEWLTALQGGGGDAGASSTGSSDTPTGAPSRAARRAALREAFAQQNPGKSHSPGCCATAPLPRLPLLAACARLPRRRREAAASGASEAAGGRCCCAHRSRGS
jgi:hypothetical protein